MLYRPQQTSRFLKLARAIATFVGSALADALDTGRDRQYLDSMPAEQLEQLGLRRTATGSYRQLDR